MPANGEVSQTVCRGSIMEAGKPQCTHSDGKSQREVGNTRCRVDGLGSNGAQTVGASQCSGGLTSHGGSVPSSCSSCHSEAHDLHRLKKDGAFRLNCTSCVLFHYKGMYCSQCFQVYSDPDQLGDPALWLTCSKCHRFCHMDCAEKGGLPTDSFFFACQYCHYESSAEKQPGSASLKRPRTDESCSLSDQETLAAAQIVSIFAAKEAKEAKNRARACVAVAAKAAKLAKSALDVAHRAGLEEMRWRLEAHKQTTVSASTFKSLQTSTYIGDVSQKMLMPPHHRFIGKAFGNMSCVSDGSKAAAAANLSHHQRRVLPPVVSPDVSGPPFMSSHAVRKPSQQQSSSALMGNGQHGSLSSFSKDQRFSRVSEASPESILESCSLLGTSKADFVARLDALGSNGVHATTSVEIVSDEEVVDDLVDVGDLLAEGFEKEGSDSHSLIDLTGNIDDVSGLPEGTSGAENCVEVSVADAHSGQPPGAMSTVSSQSGTSLELKLPENVADSICLP